MSSSPPKRPHGTCPFRLFAFVSFLLFQYQSSTTTLSTAFSTLARQSPHPTSIGGSAPSRTVRIQRLIHLRRRYDRTSWLLADASSSSSFSSRDPQQVFTDERRAELLQFLLRDLQVEGVPILSVDTGSNENNWSDATMQAALWTTLSTLYTTATTTAVDSSNGSSSSKKEAKENEGTKKLCCLVLEGVSISSLRSLVDGFGELQNQLSKLSESATLPTTPVTTPSKDNQQQQLWMTSLPELPLFQLSLLGNGMGPAIIISQSPTSSTASSLPSHASSSDDDTSDDDDDDHVIEAMQRFVQRLIVKPTEENVLVDTDTPRILYRSCDFGDAYHVMTSYWNALCEIILTSPSSSAQTTPTTRDAVLSDIFLVLPRVTTNHAQWQALMRLQTWSFGLLSQTDVEIQSYHPDFEDQWDMDDDDATTTATTAVVSNNCLQQLIDGTTLAIPGLDETTAQIMSESLATMVDQELSQRIRYRRRSPVPAIRFHRVDRESPLVTSIHSDDDFFRGAAHLMPIPLKDLQSELEYEINIVRNGQSKRDT